MKLMTDFSVMFGFAYGVSRQWLVQGKGVLYYTTRLIIAKFRNV